MYIREALCAAGQNYRNRWFSVTQDSSNTYPKKTNWHQILHKLLKHHSYIIRYVLFRSQKVASSQIHANNMTVGLNCLDALSTSSVRCPHFTYQLSLFDARNRIYVLRYHRRIFLQNPTILCENSELRLKHFPEHLAINSANRNAGQLKSASRRE